MEISTQPRTFKPDKIMTMDNGNKVKKTRYRVPTVCTVCRRRKMKCDKAKPHCTSCVKNNTTNLCVYEEQPWATNTEQQKLKDQIFQLQQQNNELKKLLSFNAKNNHSLSASSDPSSGDNSPFSANFNFILPDQPINDPVMELTEDFDLLLLKENKMAHYGSTSYMTVVSKDPILRDIMNKYLDQQKLGINFDKFFLYDQRKQLISNETCHIVGQLDHDDTSVFESDLKKNHVELIEGINKILPPVNIIKALIDHFFNETYVFIPFIDESSFRKNVEGIITTTASGQAKLRIDNYALLVSVAVLLCVLRFSFISLPVQKPEQVTNESLKRILKSGVQIGPNYIEYAKACMGNASVLRKPTLKHIAALLILRLYRFYAPEDGDESTDSTIFLALIVQMAKMHGLHRDPSRFSMVTSHATISIWRKIWSQLMYLDAVQALQFGCPLLIDDEYDTLVAAPGHTDSPLEKNCIESLKKQHEVTLVIRDLVKSCSKIKVHPKRSEIEMKIKNVEFLIMKYRSMEELSNFEDTNDSFIAKASKGRDLIYKIVLYNVHYICYYLLLLTCESNEINLMQRFANAASESALILFRLSHEYARDPSRFNKTLNFESFLSATIFDCCKRIMQVISSLCVRDISNMFNFAITLQNFTMEDSKGLKEWLAPPSSKITPGEVLLFRIEEFTQFCARLSNKYYVCWRLTFLQKMYNDYLDYNFPEILKKLHQKYGEIELAETDVNMGFPDIDPITNQYWNQLVDSANQSQFDYLAPDLNKFDNINDPFLSDAYFMSGEANFQDFNSLFSGPGSGSSGAAASSSGATDEVSPQSDSSGHTEKTKNSDPNIFLYGNDNLLNDDNIMSLKDPLAPALNDHDLAMQVARSMFGGSGSTSYGNNGGL